MRLATVMRFCKSCSFSGLAELELNLKNLETQSNTIGDFAIIEVLHTMLAVRKENSSSKNRRFIGKRM